MSGIWLKGKYVPKNPGKYVGDVTDIVYRSSWERTFMAWADNTPEILRWSSETTVIQYFDPISKKNRRYFVDFKILVKSADGSHRVKLIEIKPYKQTVKPRQSKNRSEKTMITEQATYITNQAKWAAAREVCKKMDWDFVVMTEKELFGGIDKGYRPPKR